MNNVLKKASIVNVKKALKKSPLECAFILFFSLTLVYISFPFEALASIKDDYIDPMVALEIKAAQNDFLPTGVLPRAQDRGPAYSMTVTATAYNSLPEQTDSTPFITASGTTVRHGVLAANFLPIGTRVRIPEIYGDDVFVVEDRMNPRYYKRVDIWMEDYQDAREFGVKDITIEVYANE